MVESRARDDTLGAVVPPVTSDEAAGSVVHVVVHDPRQLVREGLGELLAATEGTVLLGIVPTMEDVHSAVATSNVDVIVTPNGGTRPEWVPESVRLVGIADDATADEVVADVTGRRPDAARSHGSRGNGHGSSVGRLTPREIEVLQFVAAGLGTHEVAARMGISRHTVDNYKQSAFTKLDVNSQAQAVSSALRAGLIRATSGHDETRQT